MKKLLFLSLSLIIIPNCWGVMVPGLGGSPAGNFSLNDGFGSQSAVDAFVRNDEAYTKGEEFYNCNASQNLTTCKTMCGTTYSDSTKKQSCEMGCDDAVPTPSASY